MANSYTWDIPTFDTAPSEDGLSDVIKTIHYRYTATSDQTDADGAAYTATTYGTVSPTVDPDNFVAFASVDKAWAVAKVLAGLEMTEDELKAQLDADIAEKITPAIVSKLPDNWAA